MKSNEVHSPLAVLAPCRVEVPHVQHLVVLAHVRKSMTISVLRSSEGGGSRPPEPEFRQHDDIHLVEKHQSHYRLLTRRAHRGRGEGGEKTGENRSQFG